MLFVDFSSRFNTISPMKLIVRFKQFGLEYNTLELQIGSSHKQTLKIGSHTSSMLVLNTGAPQGSVLCPLLLTLYTHVTALPDISNNDESSYNNEINNLAKLCTENIGAYCWF